MKKPESLIRLVNSMSSQEKKTFTLDNGSADTDFMALFRIIDRNPEATSADIKEIFEKKRPGASYNRNVTYLWDCLLDTLVDVRRQRDANFILAQKTLHARVLFEKSMHDEALEQLADVQRLAEHYHNDYVLLMAQRMAIDYHLMLGFEDLDERELSMRHTRVRSTLQSLLRINEQSALYELLRIRLAQRGNTRSASDVRFLDDLVSSELNVTARAGSENFEIKKNHKLFQAYYFIAVGNYRSARRQFIELNNLFEQNPHLWLNPPIYYLSILEGILESLRIIHDHEGMEYFIGKLDTLSATATSVSFRMHVEYDKYMYTLFSYMDRGEFEAALQFIAESQESLLDRLSNLRVNQQAEAALYTALVYLICGEHRKARRLLNPWLNRSSKANSQAVWRTIRIVNMMIYYDLGDTDYVSSQRRSIMRELSKSRQTGHQVELVMLKFMDTFVGVNSERERQAVWRKIEPELQRLAQDRYESQILRKFDFTLWIKAKILNLPLSEVIRESLK